MFAWKLRLDPVWNYTARVAWIAMLKSTELELMTDCDMILMVTKGVRGGMSQCSHRYDEANNPFMVENDNSKLITYFNLNMAADATVQALELKCVDEPKSIGISQISDDTLIGYNLEVVLE